MEARKGEAKRKGEEGKGREGLCSFQNSLEKAPQDLNTLAGFMVSKSLCPKQNLDPFTRFCTA